MSIRKSTLSALALICAVAQAGESELARTAARLKPGEWSELKTKNFSRSLLDTPGSFITAFSDDAVWNSRTQEFWFLGSGHGDRSTGQQGRLIKYSADNDSWTVVSVPEALHEIGHGYDHNAMNPATGDFYHRKYFTREVHHYDPIRKSWSALPAWPDGYYVSVTGGLEYFPELGGLVYINGGGKESSIGYALLFKDNKWKELRSGLHFGEYHTFIEYNPVHRVVLFGGGEWYQRGESRELYQIDAEGKVSKLKDAPLDLGTHETIFTLDPASGKHLVFGRDRTFWEYDVKADKWHRLDKKVPFFTDTSYDNPVQGTIAAPLGDYGVVMFVSYHANRVYVYKHSEHRN